MKDFFAVVRRPTYAKAVTVTMSAKDLKTAIDDMYHYVGAKSPDDITEYQLYEIANKNRYIPVASKMPNHPPLREKVEQAVFSEKTYKSYRDVA